MPEYDILSGLPKGKANQLRKEEELNRAKELAQAGIDLIEDLKTNEGKLIKGRISKILSDRITVLIKEDPECKGLLTALNQIGSEIELARAVSDRLIQQHLKDN